MLLNAGAFLYLQDHKGNTPLHIACQQKNTLCLDTLLSNAHPRTLSELSEIRNYEGNSCVHVAAGAENTEALLKLRGAGVDIDMEVREIDNCRERMRTENIEPIFYHKSVFGTWHVYGNVSRVYGICFSTNGVSLCLAFVGYCVDNMSMIMFIVYYLSFIFTFIIYRALDQAKLHFTLLLKEVHFKWHRY